MKGQGTAFGRLFSEAEKDPQYWMEHAVLDFTEELWRHMEERGVSRAELARRLGTSPAYVTKALRGEGNFTLSTMVRFALALDQRVAVHLAPTHSVTRWIDEVYFAEDRVRDSEFVQGMSDASLTEVGEDAELVLAA